MDRLNKYRLEIKYILLAICLLWGLTLLDGPQDTVEYVVEHMAAWGLIGFFIINITGNSVVLINVPYNVITLTFALNSHSLPYMLVAGVVIGLAAGIGRVIAYTLIYNLSDQSELVTDSPFLNRVRRILERYPRATPVLIFLSAALPLPNDTTTLPLAIVQYHVKAFALPKLLGKLAHNIVLAALMFYAADAINLESSNGITSGISLVLVVLVVLFILYRVEKNRLEEDDEDEPFAPMQTDCLPN